MGLYDEIERLFRDFVRYTGDGLANEPVGAPLPTGDPASGVHNPRKADFRDAFEPLATAYDNLTGRFLGTENVTINVPTDEATIQEALDAAKGYLLTGRYTVTVNIEAGTEWDADTVTVTGNMLGVTITSADADVTLPSGFPDDSNLIHFDRCVGMVWDIHVDMDGAGSNGIFGDDAVSSIWVNVGKGVSGAGGLGDSSYPTGANILFWGQVYLDYDVDTQSGVKFTNAAKRNAWFSYAARVSGGKYADFSGGGTSATIAADDANGFGSRGAVIHMDNAKLGSNVGRTSYKATRIARGIFSGRDMEAEDVDGNAAHIFELGIATFARANLNGSGRYVPDDTTVIVQGYEYTVTSVVASDWSSIGGPNPASEGDTFTATSANADISALGTVDSDNYALISIRGSTPERPQGGGWGCFESCTYNNAQYIVAEILAPNGVLDINNSSGTGLLDKLANNSGGELLIWGVNVQASEDSRAEHMVQTSNNGITEGLGGVIDGNSVVDHAFRMSQGGRLYLRGYTLNNFNDTVFEFADGDGEAFLQDLTVDGTTYFPNGVYLRDGANFSTWQEAADAVNLGFSLTNGKGFTIGDLAFKFDNSSSEIPGMPGVVPVGAVQPGHFGYTYDDSDAVDKLIAWAVNPRPFKKLTANATYRLPSLVSGSKILAFAAASYVAGCGATFQFEETDTSDATRVVFNADTKVYDLNWHWTDNSGVGHYFERFSVLKDRVQLHRCHASAETEQPDTTDSPGFDTLWRVDGDNVELHDCKTTNIWDVCRAQPGEGHTGFRAYRTEISGYSSGFTIAEFGDDVIIDTLRVGDKNALASTNPGENAITGGCPKLTIRNVIVYGAGEHAVYLSSGGTLASPVYGLLVENVRVYGSGQCGLKLRGWADFTVRNYFGANAAANNTLGLNEDGLRVEDSFDGKFYSIGHANENGSGNGGYDGIHIDSCYRLHFFSTFLKHCGRAVIRIEDTRTAGSVSDIYFQGLHANDNTVPLLDIDVSGNLGDVVLSNVIARGLTSNVVQIDASGTVGDVEVNGDIETTASHLSNVAGGDRVVVDTGKARYVGGSLRNRYLYASAAGGGTGLTAASPATLDDLEPMAEAHFYDERATDLHVIVSGETQPANRWNIDGWPFGDNILKFIGAAAPDGINTTILDLTGQTGFIRSDERVSSQKNVYAENITGTGHSGYMFDLRYWAALDLEGCSSLGPGTLFNVRYGTVRAVGHAVGTALGNDQKYRVVTALSSDWSDATNMIEDPDMTLDTTPADASGSFWSDSSGAVSSNVSDADFTSGSALNIQALAGDGFVTTRQIPEKRNFSYPRVEDQPRFFRIDGEVKFNEVSDDIRVQFRIKNISDDTLNDTLTFEYDATTTGAVEVFSGVQEIDIAGTYLEAIQVSYSRSDTATDQSVRVSGLKITDITLAVSLRKGNVYKIRTVDDADWSSVGGPASASVGDEFVASVTGNCASLGTIGGTPDALQVGDIFYSARPVSDISALGTVAPLTVISGYDETSIGCVAQFAHLLLGNDKLSSPEPNSRGFDFQGDGAAWQSSRAANGSYAVGNLLSSGTHFGHMTRHTRVRTQANHIAGPTDACFVMDPTAIWNVDTDYPDNLSGAGRNVPVIRMTSTMGQGGEQESVVRGFMHFNADDLYTGPDRPIWTETITSGETYEVDYVINADWSDFGGGADVDPEDTFTATDDAVDIYDSNSPKKYGRAFLLSDTVGSGDVVKVAEDSQDYSGVGGPASSTKGEYFIATSGGAAGGNVYASHRGTTDIEDATKYFVVAVTASDWSAIGGSASVSVGDKFTSTTASGDISAYGAVVPAEMRLDNTEDGGDLGWRLYRVAEWFWLPAHYPHLKGTLDFELTGGSASDINVLRQEAGTVVMWSTDLDKSGAGLDHWALDWQLYARRGKADKGRYSIRKYEPSALSFEKNDTGVFGTSMANVKATFDNPDFISGALFMDFAALDVELRLNTVDTTGGY